MINRRLLRIKVLQILYAHLKAGDREIRISEKELMFSLQKSYNLYYYLMILPIDLAEHIYKKMEKAKRKNLPTTEELNPNTRFVDNKLINGLRENKELNAQVKSNKLSWLSQKQFLNLLQERMYEWKPYISYMNDEENNFEKDKEFMEEFFAAFLPEQEELEQTLEEQSLYWNDELEFSLSMIIKTIKKLDEEDIKTAKFMSMFKNTEDKLFVLNLMSKSILNYNENVELIEKYTPNWDIDRIAFMDKLIICAAITEHKIFETIPLRVTLNEYIEIAKYYSTNKSSNFINGVLDKIFNSKK